MNAKNAFKKAYRTLPFLIITLIFGTKNIFYFFLILIIVLLYGGFNYWWGYYHNEQIMTELLADMIVKHGKEKEGE